MLVIHKHDEKTKHSQNISPPTISISACECHDEGAVNELCDGNGKCTCNEFVEGEKCKVCKTGHGVFPDCDWCIDGYYDFPNCNSKCIDKSLLFFNQKWKYIFSSCMQIFVHLNCDEKTICSCHLLLNLNFYLTKTQIDRM